MKLPIFPAKCVALLVQFLVVLICIHAQLEPYRIYTVEDGLITARPQAIFQDADGFIWFGGIEGVSIYDGSHFTNFRVENNAEGENYVFNFFQRSKEEVWALYRNGIEVFVNRKFKETLPIKGIGSMLRTKDERILGVGSGGIYQFINNRPRLIFSTGKYFDRLFEIGNYFLGCQVPREKSILFDQSFHVVDSFTRHGTFAINKFNSWWFGEGNGEIGLLDTTALQNKGTIRLLPEPDRLNKVDDGHLSYPFMDSEGFIWATSNKGVIRIDKDGGIRRFNLSNGLGTNFATAYFEDVEGNVWLQTDGYIKFFNKYVDLFSRNDGLPSSTVYSIAEDSSHNIWIAQDNGITILTKSSIYNLSYPQVTGKNGTVPKIDIEGDSLWLAYYGLWLFRIQPGVKPTLEFKRKWLSWHHEKLSFANAIRMYDDKTPLLDFNGGLYHLTRNGQIEKLANDGTYYTFMVSGDELWAAPFNYGLARWKIIKVKNGLRLELIKSYDSTSGFRFMSVSRDNSGNVWAGTLYKGVIEFERQKSDSFLIRNYEGQNGFQFNNGYFFADHNERLLEYTGQDFYLLHLDRDSVYAENLNSKFGFYGYIWDMTESKNGDLWLATETGAVRIRKIVQRTHPPPKIFITGIFCSNNPDTLSGPSKRTHSFSSGQNNLSFEFTATSFRNEDAVFYSYQLQSDKSDTTWSQPKKIHQVSFASLSPGHYTFRVKALTADDMWSNKPAEFSFIITPPYYETWWFRVAILGLFLGIISGLYRYRLNQLKKLLKLRTDISRDLHDEIGSALTSINILSKVSSSNLEKDSVKTSKLLEKITEQSNDIQQSMSDIVWAIRPDNDKLENMVIRMREYLGQTAESKELKVEFNVDENVLKDSLGMHQRKDLFLIFKEAVNNAVKYSGSKKITISFDKMGHHIKLRIEDDGIGFQEDRTTSSSGLKNMRDRARDLNGTLTIHSAPGEGTTVEFTCPTT